MKITFKKQLRETGLAAIAHPYSATDIKSDGKVFGNINPPNAFSGNNKWQVGFIVKKDTIKPGENCQWKWVYVKQEFDTENDARLWVKTYAEKALKNFSIWFLKG